MKNINVITNYDLSSNAKVLYFYLYEMAEGCKNVSILDYSITKDLNISQYSLNKYLKELEIHDLIQKTNNKYFNNYILRNRQ